MGDGFIPPHGGYQSLLTYQHAELVYDATVRFCARFMDRRDRTVDQMLQAARSGKQKIVEGSMAAGHSKETEIRLTGVARASLEELLVDYRDFLRLRGAEEWSADSKHAKTLPQMLRESTAHPEPLRRALEHEDPLIAANVIIGAIKVTNYLLDRQIKALEK